MELWCEHGYHGDGTQPVYLTAYIAESKKEESWCACISPSAREKAAKTADAGMTFKFTDYPEFGWQFWHTLFFIVVDGTIWYLFMNLLAKPRNILNLASPKLSLSRSTH